MENSESYNHKNPDKAVIVGAGPVGSYLAAKISKDIETTVYEEHKIIGKPMQCTGILTSDIKKTMKIGNDIVLNKIKHANIHTVESEIKLPVDDYIINRTLFDQTMHKVAKNNGAEFIKWRKVNHETLKNEIKKANHKKKLHLIGADGPNSLVSKKIIKNKPQKLLTGVQWNIRGKFEKEKYDVFFDKEISKDFFAWVVPENEYVARVGLAGSNVNKKNIETFKTKLEKFDIQINNKTILNKTGGLIPIYNKKHRIQRKLNEYVSASLIGDAGGFVKATTGGGIIPGLESANILSRHILNDEVYNYSSSTDRDMKKLKSKLKIHLFLHNYMKDLKPAELEKLFASINNKESFESASRDDIKKLLIQTGMKNPKLVFNALRFMF